MASLSWMLWASVLCETSATHGTAILKSYSIMSVVYSLCTVCVQCCVQCYLRKARCTAVGLFIWNTNLPSYLLCCGVTGKCSFLNCFVLAVFLSSAPV